MPSRPELMKLYADVRQQNEYQIVLIASESDAGIGD